jgi:hypothetical protein
MAYIYSNLATLKLHNDSRVLVQLTNDDDTVDPDNVANINEPVLEAAENEAATMIDNHLRHVYDELPLSGSKLTPEIKLIASKLTWCNLWERRGDEPEQVSTLRKRLILRLQDMGHAASEENRDQVRSQDMMPARLQTGKTRTIYDDAGYFDGLRSRGRRIAQMDRENDRAGD